MDKDLMQCRDCDNIQPLRRQDDGDQMCNECRGTDLTDYEEEID